MADSSGGGGCVMGNTLKRKVLWHCMQPCHVVGAGQPLWSATEPPLFKLGASLFSSPTERNDV